MFYLPSAALTGTFLAVSQWLRTGALFNRYYWRHCVALPHDSVRAPWSWLDANACAEHSSDWDYNVIAAAA